MRPYQHCTPRFRQNAAEKYLFLQRHASYILQREENRRCISNVSWNTLISALVRNGCEHQALGVYYRMNREGFVPTRFTLTSVLSACGALVDVEYGRGCHGVATKFGLDKNMYVGNALSSMYAKCGGIEDAIQALGDLPEPNEGFVGD
ncbi:hypothetical protein RJ639_001231 [Escallonia herrerae]|uniref:Pentatricopeptide repeat-containing protein n=1 Tax=Escallonia herrerae TaxID=1293975 RepID=A0AA89BI19_9ASTE|nr:hypothetical protein RJ639_001231 [Escallonia herrerae]